jgi:maltose O-acetyltransferase
MLKKIIRNIIIKIRIFVYSFLSDPNVTSGSFICKSPFYRIGLGRIILDSVEFGVLKSPPFSDPIFFNPRNHESTITISSSTKISYGVNIISEDSSVFIGSNCYIGEGVLILTSDFHGILSESGDKNRSKVKQGDIFIGNDVFIGSRAIIFKGVRIGDGATISAGSRVYKDVEKFSVFK